MKRVKVLLAGAALLALSAGTANAAVVVVDFSTGFGGAGGTINIGANITGDDIFIDAVTITGAPILAANGVWDVDGDGDCADAVGGCGLLDFDENANTISIVGYIPLLGILSPVNLLTGDLSCGVDVAVDNGTVGSVTACGEDTKSRELMLALGLDPLTDWNLFGFTTGFNINQTGSPYTAISTDIINTVPEPASLALFGTGLFGLAGAFRRRFAK